MKNLSHKASLTNPAFFSSTRASFNYIWWVNTNIQAKYQCYTPGLHLDTCRHVHITSSQLQFNTNPIFNSPGVISVAPALSRTVSNRTVPTFHKTERDLPIRKLGRVFDCKWVYVLSSKQLRMRHDASSLARGA